MKNIEIIIPGHKTIDALYIPTDKKMDEKKFVAN